MDTVSLSLRTAHQWGNIWRTIPETVEGPVKAASKPHSGHGLESNQVQSVSSEQSLLEQSKAWSDAGLTTKMAVSAAGSGCADDVEVGVDGVTVFGEEVDALVHPASLVLEGGDHFGGRVAEVNCPGLVQAGQDLLDDPGGQSGVEQAADLVHPIDKVFVVLTVAVGLSVRGKQSLFFVVPQKPV